MRYFYVLLVISVQIFIGLTAEVYASSDSSINNDFQSISKNSEPSIENIGVEKIWFRPDLSQAVFIRSKKIKNTNLLLKPVIVYVDQKMAHVSDLVYFYNFSKPEIENWIKFNMGNTKHLETSCYPKLKSSPFDLLISSAHAEEKGCNKNSSNLTIIQNSKFFENFTSFVSGEAFTKIIGCAAKDPKFEKDSPSTMSADNFGKFLKESWEQLKEVIANIPTMQIPDELKSQLTCDAFLVGVMIPQNALLGSTGVGAPLAVARMYNAVSRLLKSVKHLSKVSKVNKKAATTTTILAKTEAIYKTQNMMIRNTQAAIKQILDKGRMTDPKINAKYFNELEDWVQAELNLQKDVLITAQKLKKLGDVKKIQNRVKTLEKLTQRDGALSKIDGDDFRIFSDGW